MGPSTGCGGDSDTAFTIEIDHTIVVIPKHISEKNVMFLLRIRIGNMKMFSYCGGSVAFSIIQTRLKLEPLSMWYSSSAKMKASGVSTLSSTLCDRIPFSEVT